VKFKLIIEAEYIPNNINYPAGLTPKQMVELDHQGLGVMEHMGSLLGYANIAKVTHSVEIVEE